MASEPTIWDIEARLYEFECDIDTLDLISSGLSEDRTTANVLIGLHRRLSKFHAELEAELMFS